MDAHALLMNEIAGSAVPLMGSIKDYTPLFEMIGDAQFVLIGEATHGTDEFYRIRAELTRHLIQHHGFCGVAAEADWPDSYRVNRYVRGDASIQNAHSALAEFTRFPAWMWRNEVMVEFVDWLREHNRSCATGHEKTGFYGLDVYSLQASIRAVIAYLDKVDPPAARRARSYYGCFDRYDSGNPQEYGYASAFGLTPSCEREAVEQLVALRRHAFDYMQRDGFAAGEEFFCAEQNARVIVDAEKYYRTMFAGRISSWNLRDRHMTDTLYALAEHLGRQRGERARIVVWAHNSHIGDARATEMGDSGEWNIGQLVRESHGRGAALIGFSTSRGTVTASSEWDGPAERKAVRPAMPESYEALFHETGLQNFLLPLRDNAALIRHLSLSRLQRAIGVIYLPESERQSHYFFSRLPEQFDALIHIDETRALKPLEPSGLWHKGEAF